ncbi:MAG: hypothetical protein ACI9Q3_000686 [Maribacter sp.]|jgi:hypothetical protein
MKFIRFNIIFVIVLYTVTTFSQKKIKDIDLIAIAPYVSSQIEYLPSSARVNLENKLDKIITSSGYSSSIGFDSRFILTPNITVVNKNIVAGAPPKVALVLDVTFYVGDGVSGLKYGSTSIEAKGVGTNETKAYNSAIRRIGSNNKELKKLLEDSKNKIVNYFNSNCNNILKEADNYANLNQYDDALSVLNSIPKETSKCYSLASYKLRPIYKRKIDSECKIYITKAENAWNFGLDFDAAKNAGEFLSEIDPASSCYADAKKIFDLINKSLEKDATRKWEFEIKKQENIINYNLRSLEIQEKINVARARGYNVNRWW